MVGTRLGMVRALLRPAAAFRGDAPPLGRAVAGMLAVWVPLAVLSAGLEVWRGLRFYDLLRQGRLPPGPLLYLGIMPEDLQALLAGLPPAPAFQQVWPWLLPMVPLALLGTWLHHAVWDHTGLWLLGGLRRGRGFRTSLVAEAEALRLTALGLLVGLLGFLPWVGLLLALPLLLLDGYLWLFRGFALAARHGCEPWRGVAATVVHAVLVGGCGLGLLALVVMLLRVAG